MDGVMCYAGLSAAHILCFVALCFWQCPSSHGKGIEWSACRNVRGILEGRSPCLLHIAQWAGQLWFQ
jgi:hypothetical protein